MDHKYLDGASARALINTVGVRQTNAVSDEEFNFVLNDSRVLTYRATGYSSGCDTCGYGSEIQVDWRLTS